MRKCDDCEQRKHNRAWGSVFECVCERVGRERLVSFTDATVMNPEDLVLTNGMEPRHFVLLNHALRACVVALGQYQ